LHLALETAQSIFKGLAFLYTNLCHEYQHLQTCPYGEI
jgi:hypothetical protein